MRRPAKNSNANPSKASIVELESLARLVLFARETAKDLNAEFPTYLLELAHGAIVQEIQESRAEVLAAWRGVAMIKRKALN